MGVTCHAEPASRSPDFAKSGSPSERRTIGRQREAVKRGVVRLFLCRLAARFGSYSPMCHLLILDSERAHYEARLHILQFKSRLESPWFGSRLLDALVTFVRNLHRYIS